MLKIVPALLLAVLAVACGSPAATSATPKAILAELQKVKRGERPIKEKPIDDAVTVWLEPQLVCEVQYASRVSTGNLREPVFVRLRPDKAPEDCLIDE